LFTRKLGAGGGKNKDFGRTARTRNFVLGGETDGFSGAPLERTTHAVNRDLEHLDHAQETAAFEPARNAAASGRTDTGIEQ
jgi:hypothetical protein